MATQPTPEPEYISELDDCPACGVRWRYGGDDDRAYSRIVGISNWDRVTEWLCPSCGARWERGAMTDGGRGIADGPGPGQLRDHEVQ